MNAQALLSEAKQTAVPAVRGTQNRRVIEEWMPAVAELRRKHFTYLMIWEWLKARGVDVHERPGTFISAVSRRRRRWLNNKTNYEL